MVVKMAIHERRDAKEEKEEGDGVICVVYKVNLHCSQCALEVQKPLSRTQGVQNVDVDINDGKITVKGKIDPKKIGGMIETTSNKKVEVVSLLPKKNQDIPLKKKVEEKKEVKEAVMKTTVIKVHMHCEKCEYDLKKKILKLKGKDSKHPDGCLRYLTSAPCWHMRCIFCWALEGVESVNTDPKSQTCTINGSIDPHKLIEYLHSKARKYAEIVPQKHEKEEKKERAKEILVADAKKPEPKKRKEDESKENGGEKKEELKWNESIAPYFIHYSYAPQTFSDDNPNACSIT